MKASVGVGLGMGASGSTSCAPCALASQRGNSRPEAFGVPAERQSGKRGALGVGMGWGRADQHPVPPVRLWAMATVVWKRR